MNEEKQIEELAEFCCYPCEAYSSFGCADGLNPRKCGIAIETAKRLYEAGYRKQAWISVEEALPDIDKGAAGPLRVISIRVLCACRQKSGKVFVKEGYCEFWDDCVVWRIPGSIDTVTHWMPLPEPPTMKGGAE